jgi:hypothetical protein
MPQRGRNLAVSIFHGAEPGRQAGGIMSDEEASKPAATESAKRRQEKQRERLAAALRENLQKRKQQARIRDAEE